ncbi:MAG: orotidine-5'-phosphate decarboxylase [Alphaproteobacteria bacterium]|nr:orotidine-5'-phosphate decarboxylase [Alphaproteobacteria bacterium]
MSGFVARLEARCRATDSLLCVGIDPHPQDLPEPTASAARSFGLRIVEATSGVAAAFKPNAAFFEALGPDGVQALADIIAAVPDEVPVILDVKRGDIASTAQAYARSAYEVLGADAVTLNAYMGVDAVAPFVDDPARGAFVLCRTSNPSAGELQDRVLGDGRRVYEAVADLAAGWGEGGNVGLVVGATVPGELAAVRARSPQAWILAPGVGAQGGDLEATLAAGLRADGLGLLVNSSRGIARAADPAAAASALAAQIREARAALPSPSPALDPLAAGLLRLGCVRFGRFTLKSGLSSPIYLDLRRLVGDPAFLAAVAEGYAGLLAGVPHDLLAGLPTAGLPLGTAVSLRTGVPQVYPRSTVKAHGTRQAVEGIHAEGQRVVMIDDLATRGTSALEAAETLRAAGLVVEDLVVLVDRESGAGEALAAQGIRLHAVTTITSLLEAWEAAGAVAPAQVAEVRAFLASTVTP